MKKHDLVPAWPKQAFLVRLGSCRAMLYLHGFLTDAENDKVHARLLKKFTQQPAQGK